MDLGSLSRKTTGLSYPKAYQKAEQSSELKRYASMLERKETISNHVTHAMNGCVDLNKLHTLSLID